MKRLNPGSYVRHSSKITERKLKDLLGVCRPNGEIEIDPRQPPREFLETLLHELLHRQFPMLSEDAVEVAATEMKDAVWEMGYRRIQE